MELTDEQRTQLRETILGAMPEQIDLDNNGPWWWECGCNDDGHLNDDGRMCSLSGAWEHVVADHIAPLIENWLSPATCVCPECEAGIEHCSACGATFRSWEVVQ